MPISPAENTQKKLLKETQNLENHNITELSYTNTRKTTTTILASEERNFLRMINKDMNEEKEVFPSLRN